MSVSYLDVDDEITDAVARLRGARDGKVVVVLPPGSRIASSRINFLLLAREAEGRRVSLAVVSGDPQVRAVALAAGVDSHASVPEAESALGLTPQDGSAGLRPVTASPPAPAPSPTAPPPGGPRNGAPPRGADGGVVPGGTPAQGRSLDDTQIMALPVATAGATPSSSPAAASAAVAAPDAARGPDPSLGTTRGRSPKGESPTAGYQVSPRAMGAVAGGATTSTGPIDAAYGDPRDAGRARARGPGRVRRVAGTLVRVAILVALVGGALYAAYLFVPTANVIVTPTTQTFGPQSFSVTADPAVAVPDAAAGLVPAEHVPIPLSVTDMFPASGTEVNLSPATGSVRFTSENTLFDVPIAQGTRVATPNDVEFETTKAVTLPQANFQSGPTSVEVGIRAVKAGDSGNVDAGRITVLPKPIAAQLVKVTNPEKTTGGKRTEVTVATEGDYQAAVAALTQQLQDALTAAIADPATTPRGLTLYPDTAALGKVEPDQAEPDVVGARSDEFELSAQTIGSALAVDEALVDQVASDRLTAAVPTGTRLYPETVTTDVSPGTVVDGRVSYQVSAQGQAYTPVSVATLAQQVRGKTVSDARSILGQYGEVVISVWPDFIPTIPDDVRRIDVTVEDPRLPQ